MLDKAFDKCDNLDGLVLHSDQGWQYQHFGYRKRLEGHHMRNFIHTGQGCTALTFREKGKLSGQLYDGEFFQNYEI